MALTVGIFMILAALLLLNPTPGKSPVLSGVSRVILVPTSALAWCLGSLQLPLPEKSRVIYVIVIGGLTFINAMLYAGLVCVFLKKTY